MLADPELGQNIARHAYKRHQAGNSTLNLSPSKVKMLKAISEQPTEGLAKDKKIRKNSVSDIFLSADQRARLMTSSVDLDAESPSPTTSKRAEEISGTLLDPPFSPSEGMLKPMSDGIAQLMKQNAKVLERLEALEEKFPAPRGPISP